LVRIGEDGTLASKYNISILLTDISVVGHALEAKCTNDHLKYILIGFILRVFILPHSHEQINAGRKDGQSEENEEQGEEHIGRLLQQAIPRLSGHKVAEADGRDWKKGEMLCSIPEFFAYA
jgi:hypothetical protein